MKERRYKKEYRIVTDINPRTGRPKDIAVYTGDYWHFPGGSPTPRQRAGRHAVWLGIYWLLALCYLRTGRATGRCMYALIPQLLGLIPAAYGLMGLMALWRAPERMTITHRENGPGRLTGSALGCSLLSAVAAIGCVIYLTLNGLWSAGWHEPLLCAIASGFAWKGFSTSRRAYDAMEKA